MYSVAQLCMTLCDPMDYSPPDSSVHRILKAKILEWVATSYSSRKLPTSYSYSKGSFWSRDQTRISWVAYIGRQVLHHCATWEVNRRNKEYISKTEQFSLEKFQNQKKKESCKKDKKVVGKSIHKTFIPLTWT